MYENLKKTLSFFLIFLILFNISFQLPLGNFFKGATAANVQYSDLVTVFVENAIWRAGAQGVIERYANDISKNLENTKVVIIPVPIDSSPFKIASINEKFYFEGLDGEKNLVGSVFIGNIPIPVVHDNDDFSRTIFPYVDFRDKGYIYSQISQKYEKNEKRLGELNAELWHGFISPNSEEYSTIQQRIVGITNYLNKNHEFYLGEEKFNPLNGVMTGKAKGDNDEDKSDKLHENYVPEVFYFDQKRESDSLSYSNYKGYLASQTNYHELDDGTIFRNKEDLAYNRFTKPFAEYLQDQVLGKDQEDIEGLLEEVIEANGDSPKKADAELLIAAIAENDPVDSTGLGNPNVGDIQARSTILEIGKKFVEIFSPGMTGEVRTNVRNAGRYSNTGSAVNMDSIPFLVSHLDSISDALIKSVNTKLEGEIDALVMTGGLSRNIAVPTKMAHLNDPGGTLFACSNYKEFTNFLDGTKGNYINTAADCSAYYGNSDFGGQIVEANRGLNVSHVAKSGDTGSSSNSGNPTGDITEYLEFNEIPIDEGDSYKDESSEMCATNESDDTYGYWGGKSPLNLDIDTAIGEGGEEADASARILTLREGTDLGSSITRVRDISGAELVENISDLDIIPEYPTFENDFYIAEDNKNPSPLQCLNNNYILTRSTGEYIPSFNGGIEYDDPEKQIYTDNLYYWNNEEDVLLTSGFGDLTVHNIFQGAGLLVVNNTFIDDRETKVCQIDYNLPMIKPSVEFVNQVGFSQAFNPDNISGYEGEAETFSQFPITRGDYSGTSGDPLDDFIRSNLNLTFNEPANWSCDSRNIKFDHDFTFDYIYKKIHESAEAGEGDVCKYTSAYLFGNSEVFKPSNPTGTDEVESHYEFFETVDDQYSSFLEMSDRTFTGGYLTGTYFEDLEKFGAETVPYSLREESIISELVKSNYEFASGQDTQTTSGTSDNGNQETTPAHTVTCAKDIVNYFYKEIPSYVEHKSPEPYTLYAQIKAKVTPNLPVDRDRYIDFIAANNTYQKILYPYLFRVELGDDFETENGTLVEKLEKVDIEIKRVLDEKSEYINEVVRNSNPSSLTDPIDIEIYEHLKVAEFNDTEIDLYQILQDIEETEIVSFLDVKEVSYYDFLVFSIYWNNLKSVPAKYKFVMEQYLSDQYMRPELKFLLPKNKKQYEIAYLGAPGNATEMYVSLDPEKKGDNPFTDIVYDNVELGTQLFSANVYETSSDSDFSCSPPEGVPLWEWPSAISCWLKGFENPKISFAENSCSQKTLFLTPEEEEAYNQCGGDFDKNGVEDCVQNSVPDGNIEIYSDSPAYFYNTTGKITVVLKDAEGNPIKYDSTSRVNLELLSIETRDGTVIEDESDYISYNFVDTRNSFGEANFFFTGRGEDVDIVFKASLRLEDSHGDIFGNASLESEELRIEIRGDRLFATSYKLSEEERGVGFQIGDDKVVVSDATNIFISDELNFPVAGREDALDARSNSKDKMVMSLSNYNNDGENIEVNYPVTIEIFQGIDELQDDIDQVHAEYVISGPQDFFGLTAIRESGFYRFKVTDSVGVNYSRVIQMIPDEVSRMELDLSTNLSETGRVHTPHIFILYDQYNNVADSKFYTIAGNIQGDSVTFDDLSKSKVFSTYEGFQAFKLISEDSGGENIISFSVDGVDVSENFYVVEDINLNVEPQFEELKVGGGEYIYEVTIDGAGTDIDNLNTNLFVSANDVYLEPTSPFFVIEDGVSEVTILTKKSSGIDIPIEFQAYGLRDTYREKQTILHEQAIKIDISLDKEKIEASPEGVARLTVELKDRFGNVAFTDNSSEIKLQLTDKVSRFFKPEDIDTSAGQHLLEEGESLGGSIVIDADSLSKNAESGRIVFELRGKEEPGLAYFTVAVDSINEASFQISGQSPFSSENLQIDGFTESGSLNALGEEFFDDIGNGQLRSKYLFLQDLQGSAGYQNLSQYLRDTLTTAFDLNNTMTINGVGENAGMIETYYFWKSDKIQEKGYNALYTTMIGSNYGDITVKDYLAGGILFDPENRGLAVTSLLQNPYKTDGVFRIGQESSLRKVASNEDLAQDVHPSLVLTDESTKITLNNQSINVNIGDVHYNFDEGSTELRICEIGTDIDECSSDGDITEIIFRETSLLYNAVLRDEGIVLLNLAGEEIFRINKKGLIEKDIGVQIDVDFDSREKFLKLDLSTIDGEAGILFFNFNDESRLSIARDLSELEAENTAGNSIVFHIKTNYYEAKELEGTGIEIGYRDLFNSSNDLENFVEDTPYGYESFDTEAGIGFTGTNKTLLSFASGKSVGEATRDYHSFYMINLGDPVVSLKKIPKKLPFTEDERNFDSTIGEIITREDGIVDYSLSDYNNDGREDIFIQKNGGYIKLLENTSGATKFMDRGNLLYIADLSSSSVAQTGDFDGNGYGDVFIVNTRGQPAIFMNDLKKFTRYDLEDDFALNGKITQAEVFDMDANGKHDIVILDESGEINIFFGGGTSTAPSFTKNTIETGIGATLLEDIRSDGAAVYYDGLAQLSEQGDIDLHAQDQQNLLAEQQEALEESEDSEIDFAQFCLDTPECNVKIRFPRDTTVAKREGFCKATEECMALAISETVSNAIQFGESEGYISETEIQSELFIGLPYSASVIEAQSVEEFTNAEIANFVGGNFPILTGTNAEVQAGLELSQASIVSYINESRPETISYAGDLNTTQISTFIKSEYSAIAGIEIEKRYSDNNGGYLKSGENVEAEVILKNISTELKRNIAFVDSFPEGFIIDNTADIYTSVDGIDMKSGVGGFDYMFEGFSIAPGEEIIFSFGLISPPIRVGHLEVGIFEDVNGGNDGEGDVKIKSNSNTCGAPEILYMSSSYLKSEVVPSCDNSNISEDLEEHLRDDDQNGVPDYIDVLLEGGEASTLARQEYAEEQLTLLDFDTDLDGLPDREDDSPNQNSSDTSFLDDLGELDEKAAEASKQIDTIIEGLGCGFGGGGCIASPLNWAPLAPGNDPTLFGMPIGDGLKVKEGLPVFSALTGLVTPVGCIPMVRPVSPLTTSGCGGLGAGGYLGTNNPSNFIRIFVTPTLTGAAGVAICFGGPASVVGMANAPGIHPIVPGGNCIVAAMPLPLCSNDGSDGDPSYIGRPEVAAGSDYSVIGGNCELSNTRTEKIDSRIVEAYLENAGEGSFAERILELVESGDIASGEYWEQASSTPLIQGGESDTSLDIGFSSTGEDGFVFQDVEIISMKKVNPFPDFFAGWWEKQVGEIANKLTDFPGIYIILPDLTGFMQSGWGNFPDGLKNHFDTGAKQFTEDQMVVIDTIARLEDDADDLGCNDSRTIRCNLLDIRIAKLKRDNLTVGFFPDEVKAVQQKGGAYMSGIKTAYQFLSSLPLVSVEPEKIIVTVPWPDTSALSKAKIDWKNSKAQRIEEINGVGTDISNINENFDSGANKLLSSVDKNIEIINHYLEIPGELNKLLLAKELYLEQITCNIDAINEMVNGRIDRNGKRFKAWVELYITIKAILKSWQLIVDIFYEYEAACHECKNERQDLYYFAFKLVSLILPEIPIIQFPRLPDIVMDLHNIRAGIVITLPDIEIRPKPIVLPPLPELHLPDIPSASLTLPELPLLEDYSIPELPELPSLPVVDLPDLPPPPKLPKLFSELEGMLSILKLITKVMCILKTSPFVPEWRAGDQIAFITERTGYLPTDFIDLTISSPSYSFVDEIKVSTYVTYEYETDYIIEATNSVLLPLNTFSNDVSKKINRKISEFNLETEEGLDFTRYQEDDYDAVITDDLELQGGIQNDAQFGKIVAFMTSGVMSLTSYMDAYAKEEVESKYFTKLVNENLNKKWIIRDPRFNELREVWQSVQDYSYEDEEEFIESLKQKNSEKFETVQDILKQEIILGKEQKRQVKELGKTPLSYMSEYQTVALETDRFETYQTQLDVHNNYSTSSLIGMTESGNIEQEKLEKMANSVVKSMKKEINSHINLLAQTDPDTLFTAVDSSAGSVAASGGTCEGSYADKINYKGIYILEEETPYRLFDYLEEIDGDEEHKYIDYDTDGDQDIIYMMNGVMYLKENLENQGQEIYNPGVENTNFSEMDEKFEAINGFREVVENGFVNIMFNAHTNRDVNGYRLEFYDRIDAFDNNEESNPDDYEKVTIDAFSRLDELTLINESENHIERKNIGKVTNASIVPGLEVEVDELVDVGRLIGESNSLIQISKGTELYAGRLGGIITYYLKSDDRVGDEKDKTFKIDPHSNVEFKDDVVIKGVSAIGQIYIKSKIRRTYRGSEIFNMVQLPLLENTVIRKDEDAREINNNSSISIEYYEGTEARIDFGVLKKYELLDLGPEQEEYFIRTSIENAFYYARFRPFLENELGTAVSTVLMSPQKEIDNTPPELDYSGFRIPVYKVRSFDLTPYIYENEGIRGIKEMYIDTDIETDSNNNGDAADDRDIVANGDIIDGIELEKSLTFARITFGSFDDLITKRIKVIMIDQNDNIGEKILDMEVYAPIPDITFGSTSEVRGLLRENISDEPITLFRYRGGILSKLKDIGGNDKILTGLNGEFKFNFPVTFSDVPLVVENNEGDTGEDERAGDAGGSDEGNADNTRDDTTGLEEDAEDNASDIFGDVLDLLIEPGSDENSLTIVDDQGNEIANINGDTGKVDIIDPLVTIEVLASNNEDNPGSDVLIVSKKGGEDIHIGSYNIIGGYNQVVPDFDSIDVDGMYLKMSSGGESIYGQYKLPDNVEQSAGAIVIYYLDNEFESLFTIKKDGEIVVKNENYKLEYSSYGEHIVLRLRDVLEDIMVAELLVKPGEAFTLN